MKVHSVNNNLNSRFFKLFTLTMLALCVQRAWAAGEHGEDYFGDLSPVPSYATTTGGLHIPSAEILDGGVFALQRDAFRNPRFGARASRSNNTGLTFSMGPYLEVAGRLANYPAFGEPDPNSGFDPLVLRDLSANVKLQLPRFSEYLPTLAVGITDAGGAVNFFDAQYGVATHAFGPIKATVGYGRRSNQQFAGGFGGIEVRPFKDLGSRFDVLSNLTFLLEDDSRDTHVGVRYMTDELRWLNDARVVATVSRAVNAVDETGKPFSHTDAGITLHLPLFDRSIGKRLPQPERNKETGEPDFNRLRYSEPYVEPNTPERLASLQDPKLYGKGATEYAAVTQKTAEQIFAESRLAESRIITPPEENQTQIDASTLANVSELQELLVMQGFTSVRAGTISNQPHSLVVEFDNHRYSRDEVDGFGVALGLIVTKAPIAFKSVVLVSKKLGLPVATLQVDRLKYHLYLAGEPSRVVEESLQFNTLTHLEDEEINWLTQTSYPILIKGTLEPRQVFTAGTEVGNFDNSIGVNGNIYVPLWKGAEFFASYTEQLYDTNNFGKGTIFGEGLIDGFVNFSIQQSYQLFGVFNTTTLGEFTRTAYGLQQESTKYFNNGATYLQYRGSQIEAKNRRLRVKSRTSQSLTLSHYHEYFDWYYDATYHQYLTEDSGFEFGLKKDFGDVSARLLLRQSELVKVAGLEFEIPFSFREGPRQFKGVQLNGSNVWRQGLITKIGEERNDIIFEGIGVSRFRYRSGDVFFNRQRNHQDHYIQNLPRMRDAFYKYGLKTLKTES
jgi:hypothetical protein